MLDWTFLDISSDTSHIWPVITYCNHGKYKSYVKCLNERISSHVQLFVLFYPFSKSADIHGEE